MHRAATQARDKAAMRSLARILLTDATGKRRE
jgi:hypothetical protein